MLSLSGYKVMAAADGEHAFELLERHPFDVLITALGLPGLSGFELIKQVRFKWPKTSVIVVSAETNRTQSAGQASKMTFTRRVFSARRCDGEFLGVTLKKSPKLNV